MALIGEGDPRWVVRDRTDGRNVNNWHWEDKDVSQWARARLTDLLTDDVCSSPTPEPGLRISKVESVDGDATLYNRKGVLKVLYDLKISGKWTTLHSGWENAAAECTFGDFKMELFDDDPEVSTSVDSKSASDGRFKSAFMDVIVPNVLKQCGIFVKEMNEGAGQCVDGLERSDGAGKAKKEQPKVTDYMRTSADGGTERGEVDRPSEKNKSKGDANKTTSVTMRDNFMCSASEWTRALTESQRLSAMTRSRARVRCEDGGEWVVMDGAATGKVRKVVDGKRIEMEWRLRNWGDSCANGYVTVTVSEEERGRTEVCVKVDGVPKDHASSTEGFWRVQILQAMKVVFGWGSAATFVGM